MRCWSERRSRFRDPEFDNIDAAPSAIAAVICLIGAIALIALNLGGYL